MEAMVLAAGAGTRLLPLTERIPKALIEVNGRPLLAHVLDRLSEVGATRIIVNCHFHEDQIRTFLERGATRGVACFMHSRWVWHPGRKRVPGDIG